MWPIANHGLLKMYKNFLICSFCILFFTNLEFEITILQVRLNLESIERNRRGNFFIIKFCCPASWLATQFFGLGNCESSLDSGSKENDICCISDHLECYPLGKIELVLLSGASHVQLKCENVLYYRSHEMESNLNTMIVLLHSTMVCHMGSSPILCLHCIMDGY